ncbi:MAG: hypothetical protein ACK4IS_07965 [Erythrobacter sp.]
MRKRAECIDCPYLRVQFVHEHHLSKNMEITKGLAQSIDNSKFIEQMMEPWTTDNVAVRLSKSANRLHLMLRDATATGTRGPHLRGHRINQSLALITGATRIPVPLRILGCARRFVPCSISAWRRTSARKLLRRLRQSCR